MKVYKWSMTCVGICYLNVNKYQLNNRSVLRANYSVMFNGWNEKYRRENKAVPKCVLTVNLSFALFLIKVSLELRALSDNKAF